MNASASALGTKLPPRQGELERIHAGNVERREAGGPAQQLEERSAVRGRHPAGTEGDVSFGLSRHVRHAVAIAHDRHTRARTLALSCLVGAAAEWSRLEVAANVLRGHVPAERGQTVVELRLIGRVAIEREAAVLAGRQDRPRCRRVVALRSGGFA
jgi:hypothetical protein